MPVLLILFSPAIAAEPTPAQDTLRLSLDQAIQMALSNSGEAEAARYDSVAAAARWRSSRDLWLPQLELDATPIDLSHGWSRVSANDRTTQNAMLNLTQAMPWGGSVRFWQTLGKYKIDYRDTLYQDLHYYSGRKGIELQQPLLSGNPAGRQRESARISWHTGLLAHESNLRDIEFQISTAFFNLLSAQASYEIALQDLESGRSSAELAERKMNAGFIPEVELLQIQVDLARRESSVKEVEGNLITAGDDFRRKLKLPSNVTPIPLFDAWGDTLLPEPPPPPPIEDRPDVRQKKNQLRQSELSMKNSIAGKRIDMSLRSGYSTSGGVTYTFRDALRKVNSEDSYVSFSLSIPIFGFGKTSAEIEASKAAWRSARANYRLQLEQTAADQREAYRRLERSADRIQISDKALSLSERSLSITAERFSNGLASSRDLLDAQLALTRTRNEAVRARIDYHLSLANIKRFTP